jgi:hypothetical protein
LGRIRPRRCKSYTNTRACQGQLAEAATMTSVESMRHSPFSPDPIRIPILPSSAAVALPQQQSIPMDLSSNASSSMGPPPQSQPASERVISSNHTAGESDAMFTSNGTTAAPVGAAAAAQQPKVVQTAFIHKLYKYGFQDNSPEDEMTDRNAACWRTSQYNI